MAKIIVNAKAIDAFTSVIKFTRLCWIIFLFLRKIPASTALEQMNMARMQISVMGMKNMGVMNQSQAMQFMKGNPTSMRVVPENCIILNDGTLECRDSLTNSYSFITQ
jgi:hypothetical protein